MLPPLPSIQESDAALVDQCIQLPQTPAQLLGLPPPPPPPPPGSGSGGVLQHLGGGAQRSGGGAEQSGGGDDDDPSRRLFPADEPPEEPSLMVTGGCRRFQTNQRRRPEKDLVNDPWGALERGKRSLPQLKLGSTWKQNNILEIRQTLEDWLSKCTFSIATWRHGAQSYWLQDVVAEAREQHSSWLKSSPEARAASEPEFILGDRNCIPDAMNVVESCLRVELLEAIPKQFAASCVRKGYCTAMLIIWFVFKQMVLPDDISEVSMQKELLTPPKIAPSTVDQVRLWLTGVQHRLNLCIKTEQHIHPRTLVAFVQDTLSGACQSQRQIGNIWDSLFQKHNLRQPSLTLEKFYDMLNAFLTEVKMIEEQQQLTDIVTNTAPSLKPSEYDVYMSSMKGKGKSSKDKSRTKWREPCAEWWKPQGCSKGQQCPKYHPGKTPGRCTICGSTGHFTSTCTRPRKVKGKNVEADEDFEETWIEEEEDEEYAANKGKKGKGKGKKKSKGKGKTPKSVNPQPSSSSQSSLPQKPSMWHVSTDGILFAAAKVKTKPSWRYATWKSMEYMVSTVASPQKNVPQFKEGKYTLDDSRDVVICGHDAKTFKRFSLCCEKGVSSLDREWFGEIWYPVTGSQVQSTVTQCTNEELDLEEGNPEPELCRASSSDKNFALLDSGATHVLLPSNMLPKGAKSFEVTITLAVGKDQARCWRNEIYAEDKVQPLLPLGRLANLLDLKFYWEGGAAYMQCKDKGQWKTITQFEVRNNLAYASNTQFEIFRRALWVQQSNPEVQFNWAFWKKAAMDPKMTSYLREGILAKTCEVEPYISTLGHQYRLARMKVEELCMSIREHCPTTCSYGLNSPTDEKTGGQIPSEYQSALHTLLDQSQHLLSDVVVHRPPLQLQWLSAVQPYHQIMMSKCPHKMGCHEWIPVQSVTEEYISALQPDLVIESFLDAKYYRFQPDELDMIIPISSMTRAELDKDNVVTVKPVEYDTSPEAIAEMDLVEEIGSLERAVPPADQTGSPEVQGVALFIENGK